MRGVNSLVYRLGLSYHAAQEPDRDDDKDLWKRLSIWVRVICTFLRFFEFFRREFSVSDQLVLAIKFNQGQRNPMAPVNLEQNS